ncbi:MAG TPA: hypothetical protein VFA46_10030 [Actinomycetes bacterium]|jgi:hypothetical protein|nr:hypothetical protein [Actinomycetes bacterium]
MSRLTSPPEQPERTTTRYEQPVTAGAIPAWLATAGGMTVLVAASLWTPTVVTIVMGLIVVALSLIVLRRAATRAEAGGGHGLAGLVTGGLGLLLAALLAIPGVAAGAAGLDLRWNAPAGAEPAPPDAEPQPEPRPQPTQLDPVGVEASATAGPSRDGSGSPVTFEAENVIDGKAATAWRVKGDGVGHMLTFGFDRKVHLSAIGLVPGYAKVDAVSGVNRFWQNRRVSTATYAFDGGDTVDVRFSDAADLQWLDVDADTTSVVVRITGSTEATERDYTAISEVRFVGWPTG